MAKERGGEVKFNPLGWMFTFSDLVTLLLTFFVMLLSMKAPEITKLKAVFGVFSQGSASSLGLTNQAEVGDAHRLLDAIRQPRADEFMTPEAELARQMDLPPATETAIPHSLHPAVKLSHEERGTVITLANDLMFAPGQAALNPAAKKAVSQAAAMLRHSAVKVAVEGHTDNLAPGASAAAPDNWRLSLQRALAVLHYLINEEKLTPDRFRVAALGDTRPLVPNDTKEHRAMNRRTELVLLTKPDEG